MKANELRIGNFVFHPIVDTVFEISRDDFEYHRGLSNVEHYRPIPLTEEWLLKFGFEKKGSHYYEFPRIHILLELSVNKSNLGVSFGIVTKRIVEPRTLVVNVNYVNRLQNLYFALTGEELEIK